MRKNKDEKERRKLNNTQTFVYSWQKALTHLKKYIVENYEAGDKIAPIRELASILNVSPNTIRRALLDLFNKSHDLICKIYEKAEEQYYNDSYVLQQKAIYEMKRPNGNLSKAKEYLSIAEAQEPKNTSIKHSKAELYIKIAENATRTQIEMEQYLNEAEKIIENISSNEQINTYCYSSKIKIGFIRLNYYIDNNVNEEAIKDIINGIEHNLIKGFQSFPNDFVLLQYDAELAKVLKNQERLLNSLDKAFFANTRNSNIGIRLAKLYKDNKTTYKTEKFLEIIDNETISIVDESQRLSINQMLQIIQKSKAVAFFGDHRQACFNGSTLQKGKDLSMILKKNIIELYNELKILFLLSF